MSVLQLLEMILLKLYFNNYRFTFQTKPPRKNFEKRSNFEILLLTIKTAKKVI